MKEIMDRVERYIKGEESNDEKKTKDAKERGEKLESTRHKKIKGLNAFLVPLF